MLDETRLSDWAHVAQMAPGLAGVITLVLVIIGLREDADVMRVCDYHALSGSAKLSESVQRVMSRGLMAYVATLREAD